VYSSYINLKKVSESLEYVALQIDDE
jgi:hypothetical protein